MKELGRSMSVSSVPLNGVNGGVFAFEEEPRAGAPFSPRQAYRPVDWSTVMVRVGSRIAGTAGVF